MAEKIKVKAFLPVGMCSCSQTGFTGRIDEIVRKYRDAIEYVQDSAGSEEALRLGITYRGILIGNRLLKNNPTGAEIEAALIAEIKQQDGVSI